MRFILLVHILAGGLALLAGYVALGAAKGAAVHRRSGMLFVAAMLTMSAFAALIVVGRGAAPEVNMPAAMIASYLVITALTTVRPWAAGQRRLDVGAAVIALAVGVASLAFGLEAAAGGGRRNGIPAFPFFLFAAIGLLGSAGDFRVIRSGPRRGGARLARHLWRMCMALYIAAASFFLGQADELPEALRIPLLLAIPVLVPILGMLYWLWRVRLGHALRGVARLGAVDAGAR